MKHKQIQEMIQRGESALGIEFGSTRIKAVLIGADFQPLVSSSYDWQNRFEEGFWTYHWAEIIQGLQCCYRNLADAVMAQYDLPLKTIGSIGISAMMHGYLPFDNAGQPLAAFRTWRNTNTGEAAAELTDAFGFNIPHRWSIAHLYQAMKDGEPHVKDLAFLTTLSGYVHWRLTGEKVLGIGDCAGMFPINGDTGTYDEKLVARFDALSKPYGFPWTLTDLLPTPLFAGQTAGVLTAEGAALLDPSGTLSAGVLLCPPEGDAGTGMTATNSVAPRTGNISAGTSIFSMVVLDHPLAAVHPELDVVATPSGKSVAMVHCNNGTSDLDAWMGLFDEVLACFGTKASIAKQYELLFSQALQGEPDAAGLLHYNYVSGEPITGLAAGRPLFTRLPDASLTLPGFMRSLLYSVLVTLKLGMDILTQQEGVRVERLLGHGGLFKTAGVAQRFMAAAMEVPITVMETAGEGGAWGIALLAAFLPHAAAGKTLEAFLADDVFPEAICTTLQPESTDVQGFAAYTARYKSGLAIEQAAIES